MIVVISCGAKKQAGRHPAGNLYTGPYFRAAYRWARSVADENVYVLSAKYGLVHIGDAIDCYDLTLGQPGCVTASRLREQAFERGILGEDVVVVGGTRYVELARQVWPSAKAPFGKDGGRFERTGIGYQLQALNQWIGRVP